MKIRRILFPTDFFPCAERALGHALRLADTYDAELHVLHNLVWREPETLDRDQEVMALDRISAALQEFPKNNLTIHRATSMERTSAQAILHYAASHDIDLIVMGTHGRKGVKRFLLGSVAEEVVRLATCPVVTIRSDATHDGKEVARRILAPVDFSEPSLAAVARAKQLAFLNQAELFLLHAVPDIVHPGGMDAAISSIAELCPDLEKQRLAMLESFGQRAPGPDHPYQCHVIIKPVLPTIIDFIEEKEIDYVVLGTHGHTGLTHLMIGSVSERVVRLAPCPVFTVKCGFGAGEEDST